MRLRQRRGVRGNRRAIGAAVIAGVLLVGGVTGVQFASAGETGAAADLIAVNGQQFDVAGCEALEINEGDVLCDGEPLAPEEEMGAVEAAEAAALALEASCDEFAVTQGAAADEEKAAGEAAGKKTTKSKKKNAAKEEAEDAAAEDAAAEDGADADLAAAVTEAQGVFFQACLDLTDAKAAAAEAAGDAADEGAAGADEAGDAADKAGDEAAPEESAATHRK